MPQTLFTFEQAQVDAEQAAVQARLDAKNAVRAERENRKHQEELDKAHRRLQRDMARRLPSTLNSQLPHRPPLVLPQSTRPRTRFLLAPLPCVRPAPHLHRRPQR